VGWCQFGPTDELPRIKRRRAYLDGLTALPDWRITCFFVDRRHRRSGVASAALAGALEEIARLGGGTVESYPEDAEGRSVSASFLHNGTVSLFERHGFERTRRLGKHHWVVTRAVRRHLGARMPSADLRARREAGAREHMESERARLRHDVARRPRDDARQSPAHDRAGSGVARVAAPAVTSSFS
jgi:GNAT superfamily N-acetyltransferase